MRGALPNWGLTKVRRKLVSCTCIFAGEQTRPEELYSDELLRSSSEEHNVPILPDYI
ncbi:hypothetical protein YC2023_105549 [Brassica napus]